MRIAVYSGSFNPLHIGHLAIMQHLRDRFDWTYLVVSPKNPLKDSISADTGTDRYRAAVQAVCRHPELKVWVEDIELGMEPPHYTIRTLDALKARESEHDYTLVIGADNLADIHRGRDCDRIMTEDGLAVYPAPVSTWIPSSGTCGPRIPPGKSTCWMHRKSISPPPRSVTASQKAVT